jgi:chitinase
VLGVPSYGYISQSTATTLQTRAVPRDDDDESAASDNGAVSSGSSGSSGSLRRRAASQVRVNNDDGGSEDGQVQFRSLVAQGALVRTNVTTSGEHSPRYVGGGGFERHWDACSGTPFLRSAPAGQVITYDDPESLGAKAAFAARMGMRGVNMFDVHGDVDEWALIDGVRAQLGLS